jgi:chemotaxis methyl-accepting protein methylase
MQNPEWRAMAIDSLLIGVTEFFRVWSAGCSNGAELLQPGNTAC